MDNYVRFYCNQATYLNRNKSQQLNQTHQLTCTDMMCCFKHDCVLNAFPHSVHLLDIPPSLTLTGSTVIVEGNVVGRIVAI